MSAAVIPATRDMCTQTISRVPLTTSPTAVVVTKNAFSSGVSGVPSILALVTDFFLMAWLLQVAWNQVSPKVSRGRLSPIDYTDALAMRVGLYCLTRSFFCAVLVQSALCSFWDRCYAMVEEGLMGLAADYSAAL